MEQVSHVRHLARCLGYRLLDVDHPDIEMSIAVMIMSSTETKVALGVRSPSAARQVLSVELKAGARTNAVRHVG